MQIRKSVAPKREARTALRDIEALKLRGDGEMTFTQIAAKLGISVNAVRRACQRALERARQQSADLGRDIRDTLLNDNEGLLLKLTDMLLDPELSIDDQMKIIDRIHKLQDQTAKLVGAYAATKTEADVTVSPAPAFVPKDELLERLRQRGVAIDVINNN